MFFMEEIFQLQLIDPTEENVPEVDVAEDMLKILLLFQMY